MNEPIRIDYGTGATIELVPGRALRLSGADYPLFRPPPPAGVALPDDCLAFLREFHLSHCGVFDVKLRQWMTRYFEALRALVDGAREALAPVAGLDPAVAHLAWCYAAYRPLPNAAFEWAGAPVRVPALLWREEGPLAIRFGPAADGVPGLTIDGAALVGSLETFTAAMAPVLEGYWRGVVAPRHPFMRSPLSGLR
jgi:hypothetical protein